MNTMVTFLMLLVLYDTDTTAVPMVSHDQKGHVVPHFDYLDVMNAIV